MGAKGCVLVAMMLLTSTLGAAARDLRHASCTISASEEPGSFRLQLQDEACNDDEHCGSNFDTDSVSRFTGITPADLGREGAQLTATLNAEAGTFSCAGTVHSGALRGSSSFAPNQAFVDRMRQIGLSGLSDEKLETYALFDITTAWVQSLQQAKVDGITADNLIALKIFHIDPAYVAGFTGLGYEVPDADKLIALKVQGVNAEEVRQIRGLGFHPSLDELIQIRIFHITPDFIRKMQARGFQNLTISKLVQIKIFKMDE